MINMEKTLVVGGALAGLGVTQWLQNQGVPVVGLERGTRLGGRHGFGDQRLYSEIALGTAQGLLGGLEWERVDDAAVGCKKGEMGPLPEDLSEAERFYVEGPFWRPAQPLDAAIEAGLSGAFASFRLGKTVVRVDLDACEVECADGERLPYHRLIWTGSVSGLVKAAGRTPAEWGNPLEADKDPGVPGPGPRKGRAAKTSAKPAASGLETGGITWDLELTEPVIDRRNAVVLPVRFKDFRFHALGCPGGQPPYPARMHWMLFLADALMEDREELAKIVRALKRECARQFPTMAANHVRERIAQHASLSGEAPLPAPSLEVFPHVVCLGTDICPQAISPNHSRHGAEQGLRNLDRTVMNLIHFQQDVWPEWRSVSPGQRDPAA